MSTALDLEQLARYRAMEEGPRRSRLEGTLVLDNEGLTKVLTAQLCGRGENRPGRRQAFKKEPGSELLTLEEAHAAGTLGMLKAIRGYRPGKAGLAIYAAWKIRNEIQAAILKARMIYVPRGTTEEQGRPKAFDYLDGDALERELDHEPGETLSERMAREAAEDGRPARVVDSAVQHFVATRLRFHRTLTATRDFLFGSYERHAKLVRARVFATAQLQRILEAHGAEAINGHAPGSGRQTVRFFRGVGVTTFGELERQNLVAS